MQELWLHKRGKMQSYWRQTQMYLPYWLHWKTLQARLGSGILEIFVVILVYPITSQLI